MLYDLRMVFLVEILGEWGVWINGDEVNVYVRKRNIIFLLNVKVLCCLKL